MTLAAMPPDAGPSPADYERDMAILAGMSKPGTAKRLNWHNGASGGTIPGEQNLKLVESADSFIARYVPLDYVIDGFLIRGYLYGLTSMSNHGKTMVGTAIALHIATGTPFAGMETSRSGRVLVMYGENADNSRLQLIAAMQHFDLTIGNIDIISRKFPLNEYVDQVIAECTEEYAFVLVDSSASYYSYTEENSNDFAHDHATDLRRLTKINGNPCVFTLCHPTKSATKDTLCPRGGGAFENELDTSLRLWKTDTMTELYAGNKVRGPLLDGIQFDIKQHTLTDITDKRGRPFIVPVSVPMGEVQAAAHHKQMNESDDRLLYAMLHHPGLSISGWASACGWTNPSGKPMKSKAQRSMDRLLADKLVIKTRKGYELTQAGEKEAKRVT